MRSFCAQKFNCSLTLPGTGMALKIVCLFNSFSHQRMQDKGHTLLVHPPRTRVTLHPCVQIHWWSWYWKFWFFAHHTFRCLYSYPLFFAGTALPFPGTFTPFPFPNSIFSAAFSSRLRFLSSFSSASLSFFSSSNPFAVTIASLVRRRWLLSLFLPPVCGGRLTAASLLNASVTRTDAMDWSDVVLAEAKGEL